MNDVISIFLQLFFLMKFISAEVPVIPTIIINMEAPGKINISGLFDDDFMSRWGSKQKL